ncbi:hypothetical protein [Azospirillum sp. B4]|uniref:hypothetical protein n=1 Tax=Azospirillum sp. B4 TaxID=95605 RepID=UPI000346A350|nr:hypothetical protein [Azospirillum sp. B4]
MNDRAYEIPTVARLLETHNQGDDGAALNEKFAQVLENLGAHVAEHRGTAKGEVTVKITLTADPKGVDVEIAFEGKVPRRPKTKDRYFLTERGNALTLKNPNQGTMFEGRDLGRAPRAGA